MSWLRTFFAPTTLATFPIRAAIYRAAMYRALGVALIVSAAPFAAAADGDRVDVNTADAATIARVLNGVGLTKAKAIVRYREENGRFDAPADLAKVKGIGAATVARNEGKIVIGEGVPAVDAAERSSSGD